MADQPFDYSDHAAQRIAERGLKREWIEQAIAAPDQTLPDDLDPSLTHA